MECDRGKLQENLLADLDRLNVDAETEATREAEVILTGAGPDFDLAGRSNESKVK